MRRRKGREGLVARGEKDTLGGRSGLKKNRWQPCLCAFVKWDLCHLLWNKASWESTWHAVASRDVLTESRNLALTQTSLHMPLSLSAPAELSFCPSLGSLPWQGLITCCSPYLEHFPSPLLFHCVLIYVSMVTSSGNPSLTSQARTTP